MAKAAVVESNEQTALQKLSARPQELVQFVKDTRQEMTKVHTPSWVEVQSTTIVVIVTVFLFAAFFEAVDLIFGKAIDQMFLYLARH